MDFRASQRISMDETTFREVFLSLPDEGKLDAFLFLAAGLTVFARSTYVPGTEEIAEPARLRRLNELQHRILYYLLALHQGNTKRYPDELILDIMLDDYPHDWPELK